MLATQTQSWQISSIPAIADELTENDPPAGGRGKDNSTNTSPPAWTRDVPNSSDQDARLKGILARMPIRRSPNQMRNLKS